MMRCSARAKRAVANGAIGYEMHVSFDRKPQPPVYCRQLGHTDVSELVHSRTQIAQPKSNTNNVRVKLSEWPSATCVGREGFDDRIWVVVTFLADPAVGQQAFAQIVG